MTTTPANETSAPKKKGFQTKSTGTGDGAKAKKAKSGPVIDLSKVPSNAAYLRAVRSTLAPVADSRKGLRAMMKTRQTLILSHAITGIGTEIGELIEAMSPYILGNQLSDGLRAKFKDESGDLLYYAHLAAKQLGVKLPSPRGRVKYSGTPTEALMDINAIGVRIASAHKKMYYGQELNQDKLREAVIELVERVSALTWQLLGHAPGQTMLANMAKLQERFKVNGGKFSTGAVEAHKAATATA